MKLNAVTKTSVEYPDSKSEKSRRTQQKLVEAGIDLFSTYGYDATTTRNVELRASVILSPIISVARRHSGKPA